MARLTPLRAYEMRELARVIAADETAPADLRDMIAALEDMAEHGEQWQCATCGRWWCGPGSTGFCVVGTGSFPGGTCASRPASTVAVRDAREIWGALRTEMRDLGCVLVENGGPYQITDECVHLGKREHEELIAELARLRGIIDTIRKVV